MKILFKTIVLAGMLAAFSLQAQIPQEMIDKAKAAGMTDAQIQQEIEKRMGSKEVVAPQPVTPVAIRKSAQRKNPVTQQERAADAETANRPGQTESSVFGREIFTDKNLTFEPDLNIPTPKDYKLASGDEVLINVWGASEITLTQKISPEGVITIPNVGPVTLSGLSMEEASARIKQSLGRIMSGLVNGEDPNTYVTVSLSQIRSIKINVVGEALNPGTYTLPSVASLFNALYAAGGVSNIGTLRDIKVYRNSKEVATLDVYEYLLNGKFDSNIRLENNDMIIIGTYSTLVQTSGKLKRNRIFELKKGETLKDVIRYAGGFMGDAFTENVRVVRKAGSQFSIATVDSKNFESFLLMDEDAIEVDHGIPMFSNRLRITGAVWRKGSYELNNEIKTVKQLVNKAGGVKGDEFVGRAQITRQNPDFTKNIIAVDLVGIMKGTSPDIALQPEDELYIPSLFDLREKYTISVRGAVNIPDTTISFSNNMTVEDVIISAGGLREAASMIKVEVARRIKDPYSDQYKDKIAKVFNLTLTENLKIVEGEEAFTLEPFDEVIVRFSPGYQTQKIVTANGEVLFTGPYVLTQKNERLSDLVAKAGGVSNQAYIEGASLVRKLNDDEKRRLKTVLEMSSPNKSGRDSVSMSDIQLNDYSVGIDLKKALKKPGGPDDITIRDGDQLFIPQYQSTVKISGAVTYPNSVTYSKGMSTKDCLAQAGGYTDTSRKYPIVIYMNGKVATTKRVAIFFKKYPKIAPGAEILVPMKRRDQRGSLAEILSVGSSVTSMAAMITSIVNNMR